MAVKIGRENREEEVAFEMPVSTIDVVFLLLIFFMCTAKFKQVELQMDANLPMEGPPTHILTRPVDEDPIYVKLWSDANGELAISLNDRDNRIDGINQLAVRLEILRNSLSQISVLIDARRDVKYQHVIAAMDACKRARIQDVKFALAPEALESVN
jgi:biopolymer transport protein ExbD